ncbi:MAG: cell division protein ZapE [Gammaproteobacteria bacterium]|jgi:cell division protein ZapE
MSIKALYTQAVERDGVLVDQAQLAALDRLEDLQQRLTATVEGRQGWFRRKAPVAAPQRGVYLWGGVGRGKTWLMDLFYQSLAMSQKERLHYHRFMQRTHRELAACSGRSDPLVHVARQLARRVRVVCLDEFVVTDIGDAVVLARWLQALFAAGVTLVTTANVPPDQLYRDGIQRASFLPAIDLLERHTEVLELRGERDYRRRILADRAVFHTPLGPTTEERLHAEFMALAKEAHERDGELEVLGRRIPFRYRAGGMIWFDFDALCGPPRSQLDYIEVARCHHTVIISDIPRLDGSSDDRTRRFVFLIDEFYDRNVKLVVSAAADPQRLYCGERLAFEFRRTASRLAEMRTDTYLARAHRG